MSLHRPKGGVMPEEEKTTEEGKEEEKSEEESSEEESNESSEKKEDLEVTNKRLLSESIKNKKGRQKAEKELEKIREAKLSEDEKKDLKLKQEAERADTAEAKLKASNVDTMIMGYASTLGFQDLDVVKLIAKQELGDEDEISKDDVKSVIDSIAKEKPYLLDGSETTKVGPGNFEGGAKVEKEETIDDRFKKALQRGRTRNII